MEKKRVLKLVLDDLPDYPMFVDDNIHDMQAGIQTMMDGHPIFDNESYGVNEGGKFAVILRITAEEMPLDDFLALEAWEV